MARVTPGRRAVQRVLSAVARGRRLDRAVGEATSSMEPRERRWVRELAYGTQRLRGRLDHLLSQKVHRSLERLDPVLLDILRAGAYQLLYMDGVPDYAVISQSVELAGAVVGRSVRGLTNAVLRSVADRGEEATLFPDPESEPLAYLTTWGSHPEWLIARWLERWPYAQVLRLVELNNTVPHIYLHTLGVSSGASADALRAAGVQAEEVGQGTGCLRLGGPFTLEMVLAEVRGIVQDPAAALVTHFVGSDPTGLTADLCAAPGGKAVALAEGAGYLFASDPSLARLLMVRESAQRLGSRVGLVVARAEDPPLNSAQLLLLDVPCSGTGTLRRNPDAKWKLTPQSVSELAELQRRLLEGASRVVSPGGVLVYSTCTLEPEENDRQMTDFLRTHPDFKLEASVGVEASFLDSLGRLSVTPQAHGFDGAFATRLRRVR